MVYVAGVALCPEVESVYRFSLDGQVACARPVPTTARRSMQTAWAR
jgi:hypothetical protein